MGCQFTSNKQVGDNADPKIFRHHPIELRTLNGYGEIVGNHTVDLDAHVWIGDRTVMPESY